MHPIVRLARHAVETYIREKRIIALPDDISDEMRQKAGVFVSLKKQGQLRGCIGTYMPSTENIAAEVIQNAISAAVNDSRFYPLEESELDDIQYSVDILGTPEKVSSPLELDPKIYGVIVKKGLRKGLLLPDLEGVDSVEEQLRIAKLKAGISLEEDVELYRFEVRRYR